MASLAAKAIRRTFQKVTNRSRGIALIELVVVVGLIAVFSAALAPNYLAVKRGQEDRAFLSHLRNILVTGKVLAIEQRRTVAIAIDENNAFTLTIPATNDEENDQVFASLPIPESFTISRLFVGADEVGQEDWTLNFFADGTCDGGAIELDRGNMLHGYLIDRDSGRISLASAENEIGANRSWPAGTYETRQ